MALRVSRHGEPVAFQAKPIQSRGWSGSQGAALLPTVRDRFIRTLPVRFHGQASPAAWPFGVSLEGNKTRLKLWAPAARSVELLIIRPGQAGQDHLEDRIAEVIPMQAMPDGNTYYLESDRLPPGTLYMYRMKAMNGAITQPLPDPRSRYQPEDVHGPSQIVDLRYQWQAQPPAFQVDKRKLVIYEMHMGTFTQEGTFEAAIEKLDYLKSVGFNAIEVMPVKEFAGKRSWGYDMVGYFATENAYGKPADFQRFVDEAHKRGIAVILDVVYNHIGPEGNYFRMFDHDFLSHVRTDWGETFNWENPRTMEFVTDNIKSWIRDFNVDGFRFDMTNFIPDHALRQLTSSVQTEYPKTVLIAEDGRDSNHVTLPVQNGGLGFWLKWNFPFHHRNKSVATGQSHMGASTSPTDLSWVIEEGFAGPGNRMNTLHNAVNKSTSHDEIGNHDGIRTNLKTTRERFIVGSALKYLLPGAPMAFMGEEYAEKNPFYFFADYSDSICRIGVREGRSKAPQPDCLSQDTFTASKLSWQKDEGIARLTGDLLRLRRMLPSLWQGDQTEMRVDRSYLGSNVLVIHRRGRENPEDESVIVVNFSDATYPDNYQIRFPQGQWKEILNTADPRYGGKGPINENKLVSGTAPIGLPGWSIAVFHKKRG